MPVVEGEDKTTVRRASTVIEALLNSLEDMREAQTTAVKSLNELIVQVQRYKVELLSDLAQQVKSMERRIEEAIRDILTYVRSPSESSQPSLLSLPPTELHHRLQFINVIHSDSQRFNIEIRKIFAYIVNKEALNNPLPSQAPQCFLHLDALTCFLVPAPFETTYQTHIEGLYPFLDFSAWCLLRNSNILITASRSECATVSLDSSGSFAVPLHDTLQIQWKAGIIPVDNRVFLFGGVNSPTIHTAEVYDVMENKWTFLPDMISYRAQFQPCFWKEAIYLFGGNDKGLSERFSLVTFQYEVLKIQGVGRGMNVSFCANGSFFIFTNTVVLKWDEKNPPVAVKENLSIGFYSPMSPVQVGDNLFFLGFADKDRYLMKMDLRKLRLDVAIDFPQIDKGIRGL